MQCKNTTYHVSPPKLAGGVVNYRQNIKLLPKIVSLQNQKIQNHSMTIKNQILDAIESFSTFNVAELQDRLAGTLSLDRSRLNWYLAKLADQGKIVRVAHGIYSAKNSKKQFVPQLSPETIDLYDQFHADFPEINMCVYEGNWLFQFMHHLASNQITYIEVEKDLAETVFHRLQDQSKTVYLRPNEDLISKYIDLAKGAIFVKNLTTESPLQTCSGTRTPTLEKMLVDMYCDPDFFYLQGAEYYHIMHNARTRYTINQSRLFRYARRRNVSQKIQTIFDNTLYDID